MTLGQNCANAKKTASFSIILEKKPEVMPLIVDESPQLCPECKKVNGQKMWKITNRDFKSIKKKLEEQDDFANYLIDIIGGFEDL